MEEFSFENIKWLKLILIKKFASCLPNHNFLNVIFKLPSKAFRITQTKLLQSELTYLMLLKNKQSNSKERTKYCLSVLELI